MSTQPPSEAFKSSSAPQGTIYLLRHGAIRSPEGGKRYIGWQDHALSDLGLVQASQWADYFAGARLKDIYCSDLARCLDTARIIGTRSGVEPKLLPDLREICLGTWEGQRFETVQALYPQAFQERGDNIADYHPPGGESFRDLQSRAWPVFEAIVRGLSGQSLIVTHAGVIRVLLCRLLGMPLENLFCIKQAYGALNIIEVRPETYRLQAVNLHSPLDLLVSKASC
jgi:broad specificity phosphatase PhoE